MSSTAKKQKPRKSPWRRARRIAAWGASIVILSLLAFPWWSVLLAKPLLQRFAQIKTESVELDSWKRWQVTALEMDNPEFTLEAKKLSVPSPANWLLKKGFGDVTTEKVFVENWTLRLHPAKKEAPEPAAPIELPAIFDQVNAALKTVRANIGGAEARDGLVLQGSTELLRVPELTTDAKTASLSLVYLPQELPVEATLDLSDPAQWKIDASSPEIQARLEVASTDALRLQAQAHTSGNQIELSARWDKGVTGLLPEQASLSANAFKLDQRYPFWGENPPLALDARITWEDEQYRFELQSSETEQPDDAPHIDLAGTGNLQSLSIDSALVDLPWLRVQSDAPIVVDFSLENPLEQAELVATADLERLPWIEASGALRFQLTAQTSEGGLPSFNATLEGNGIGLFDTQFESLQARVRTEGKTLILESLLATTTKGSTLDASGGFDLETNTFDSVSASLNLQNESERLRALLPLESWNDVTAKISLSGQLKDARISAQAQASQIGLPSLKPLDIKADLEGTLAALSAKLEASSGPNQIKLELAYERNDERIQASITTFSIASSQGPTLALNAPATASFSPASGALQVDGFSLRSSHGSALTLQQLRLSRDELALQLFASELRPEFFAGWLTEEQLPSLYIIDLNTELALDENQSSIRSSGEVNWSLDANNTIEASWRASQTTEGARQLKLEHLEIGSQGKHILRSNGTIPASISWSDNKLNAQLLKESVFNLDLHSTPHPDFWRSLESLIPIAIDQPTINAQLSGTLLEPQGKLDLSLASLTWKPQAGSAPPVTLSDVQTSIAGDNGILTINTLRAKVGENTINASASLPLRGGLVEEFAAFQQRPDLAQASGNATIDIVDFSVLGAWLPDFVRRQGKARIEAKIESGAISALATVENLATRPLPPLGAMSKVGGSLRYQDGLIRLEKINGMAEQSPFTLGGSVDLRSPRQPVYNLAFKSKDFPLIRDAGLLFTGDIDLSLVSKDSAPPTIAGTLNLNKGLVLIEPDLLASSTKTAQQRPPYFAVEQEPFKNWDLEVAIKGDRFLRVSNAFFDGTLSADFILDGSLGSPLLIGKAEAANGRIKFPASTLELINGEAIITRDRPNEIQIEANAEERLFAYDINLNVIGELSDLDITITTNPALTQVQALLLVTTGAVPDTQGSLAQSSATSIGLFLGKGLLRKLSGSSGDAASRLAVEVGNDISRQGKKTIQATYQLAEDLEIEGEYDERDEYNANFKWTFYKK